MDDRKEQSVDLRYLWSGFATNFLSEREFRVRVAAGAIAGKYRVITEQLRDGAWVWLMTDEFPGNPRWTYQAALEFAKQHRLSVAEIYGVSLEKVVLGEGQ